MAYVGIQFSKCSHCGSYVTVEEQQPKGGDECEVFLRCYACNKKTSYGIYIYIHGSLIKKDKYDEISRQFGK